MHTHYLNSVSGRLFRENREIFQQFRPDVMGQMQGPNVLPQSPMEAAQRRMLMPAGFQNTPAMRNYVAQVAQYAQMNRMRTGPYPVNAMMNPNAGLGNPLPYYPFDRLLPDGSYQRSPMLTLPYPGSVLNTPQMNQMYMPRMPMQIFPPRRPMIPINDAQALDIASRDLGYSPQIDAYRQRVGLVMAMNQYAQQLRLQNTNASPYQRMMAEPYIQNPFLPGTPFANTPSWMRPRMNTYTYLG